MIRGTAIPGCALLCDRQKRAGMKASATQAKTNHKPDAAKQKVAEAQKSFLTQLN